MSPAESILGERQLKNHSGVAWPKIDGVSVSKLCRVYLPVNADEEIFVLIERVQS
jgi:hypothetical protein